MCNINDKEMWGAYTNGYFAIMEVAFPKLLTHEFTAQQASDIERLNDFFTDMKEKLATND